MAPVSLRTGPLSLWSDMADNEDVTLEMALPDSATDAMHEVDVGTFDDSGSENQMPVRRRRRRGKHGSRRDSATIPVSKPDPRPMSVVELFGLTLPSSSSRIATGTDAGATAGTTASCFAKPTELAPHYFEAPTSSMWYAASWNHSPLGTVCPSDVSGSPWAYAHPMYPSQWPCAGHVSNSQSVLSYPAPAQPAAAASRMFGSELNENTVNMLVCNQFVGTLPPSAEDHNELSAKDHEELLRNARPEKYED